MTLADFWRRSLAGRLVLLAAAWSVGVLLISGVAQTALFHQAAITRSDDDLFADIQNLYAGASVDDQGQVEAPPLTDPAAVRAYSGSYWEIAEPEGGKLHALVRSRSLWDGELEGPPGGPAALQAVAGKPIYYDSIGPAQEPLRMAAMLARLPGRSAPVVFLSGDNRAPIDAAANRFAAETAFGLIVLGVGLVLMVFIQVRVGLRPLFDLSGEVSAVRIGKADRLEGDYPSELKPLADELNALIARDAEIVERQRTHVGNLAHALKTPLSVMLAEAERQAGSLAEVVVRQAEAMREQVDHYLQRARTAARSQGSRERTLVAPVLEELALALERIFGDRPVEIDWRAPDDLCFQGERQDFQEIVGNLLENACKFSRGRVRAEAVVSDVHRLSLTIDDNGAGLPAERRKDVLKRGARLDESAPGSGLGLSIVEDLARAYGGSVSLSDSPMGGLRVTLDLPRAEA